MAIWVDSSMDQNEIQYQLTPRDLIEANKAHLKATRIRWVMWCCGILFLAGGLLGFGVGADASDVGSSILLGLFFVIGTPWMMAVKCRRRFKREPALNKPIFVIVGPEGLQMSGHHFTGNEEWAAYNSYLETPRLFLLYVTPGLYRVIPKRAMHDAQAVGAFAGLLATRIGKTRRGWFH